MMWILRGFSGVILFLGLIMFIQGASYFFVGAETTVEAWHRVMAGCALFMTATLASIYDKLDQIAKQLRKSSSATEVNETAKNWPRPQ
jgi:hypothetical protein